MLPHIFVAFALGSPFAFLRFSVLFWPFPPTQPPTPPKQRVLFFLLIGARGAGIVTMKTITTTIANKHAKSKVEDEVAKEELVGGG